MTSVPDSGRGGMTGKEVREGVGVAPGTPLPWSEWHGDIIAKGDASTDHDDYVIAGIGVSRGCRSSVYCPVKAHKPEGQANARYIVHACNLYPELLEALEKAEEAFEEQRPFEDVEACCSVPSETDFEDELLYNLRCQMRAALSKARGHE